MEYVPEHSFRNSGSVPTSGHGLRAWVLLTGAVLVAFLLSAHFLAAARWAATTLLLGGALVLALRAASDASLGMAVVTARAAILMISLLYVGPYYLRTTGSDAELYHDLGIASAQQLWRHASLPDVAGSLGTREYTYLTGLAYLLMGPSDMKMRLLNSLAAAVGSWLFLRGFENRWGPMPRLFRMALLFWPSVLYWTSIHGKDPWAYFFLSLGFFAFVNLVTRPSLKRAIVYLAALGGLFLIRPQIALLFLAAATVALWLAPREGALAKRLRSIRVLSLAGIAGMALFILTAEAGLEEITGGALFTHLVRLLDGLSTGATAIAFPVLGNWKDLLLYLPQGMVTVMFRPFPWEHGNLYLRLASFDQLGLTVALLIVLWKLFLQRHPARPRLDALAIFLLSYCAGFIGLFALLSGNVGTLARERVQLIPFAVCCAAALCRKAEAGGRGMVGSAAACD